MRPRPTPLGGVHSAFQILVPQKESPNNTALGYFVLGLSHRVLTQIVDPSGIRALLSSSLSAHRNTPSLTPSLSHSVTLTLPLSLSHSLTPPLSLSLSGEVLPVVSVLLQAVWLLDVPLYILILVGELKLLNELPG